MIRLLGKLGLLDTVFLFSGEDSYISIRRYDKENDFFYAAVHPSNRIGGAILNLDGSVSFDGDELDSTYIKR